ncbi:helix-turn-helix domain-containing protein [Nocardioides marmoriginsengisoli]|uniref:helix-turn-helix domain-containing protein n=1 Tax=Nocardioides marmoriginsengisoli TaxID=661483 RepID=UPI0011CE2E6D|nr:helix-turn-helix transcriptional regulator [Nocardioides marmoriginsengisoli]
MNAINDRIAANVATLLHLADWSQRELGRQTGLAATTITHKMRGRNDWTTSDLDLIGAALSVSAVELVGDLPTISVWRARREPAALARGPRYLVEPDPPFDRIRPPLSPNFDTPDNVPYRRYGTCFGGYSARCSPRGLTSISEPTLTVWPSRTPTHESYAPTRRAVQFALREQLPMS